MADDPEKAAAAAATATAGGASTSRPSNESNVRPSHETTTTTLKSTSNQPDRAPDQNDDKQLNEKAPAQHAGSFLPLKDIPIEQLYDHEHYDLTKMEPTDVFRILE